MLSPFWMRYLMCGGTCRLRRSGWPLDGGDMSEGFMDFLPQLRPVTIIGTRSCAKLGTVQASELVRSFLRSERPSSLASAIMELGPANKTIYLLNYVDDTAYRRRILTQLNRGQSRHRVIRAICYGRRGEI